MDDALEEGLEVAFGEEEVDGLDGLEVVHAPDGAAEVFHFDVHLDEEGVLDGDGGGDVVEEGGGDGVDSGAADGNDWLVLDFVVVEVVDVGDDGGGEEGKGVFFGGRREEILENAFGFLF